uniref:Flagellin n=1 Tax=uncultured Planctomycetota bacterium TaxID=120965 RepID=A0A5B8KHX5_9BACT|nr:flagellin A [uncultured Planctomycetota bacterium]
MALTVNNLNTLHLLNILTRTSRTQDAVFERMSTGYRINRGADDPAGLIALTSLNAELTAVDAAISNNQRTDAILGVADGALMEVGNLIADIQRLANEAASEGGLSADELAANQAQIDDALASIDRIVGSTQFNGKKLLDGSLGITTTISDATKVSDVKVYNRRSGSSDTVLTVDVTGDSAKAEGTGWMTAAATADTTVSIQGKLGTAVVSWSNAETTANIATLINAATAQTGVVASNNAAGNLALISQDTGEAAIVRTSVIEGQTLTNLDIKGTDATVTVNGQATAVDGDSVSYSGGGTSVSFNLTNFLDADGTITVTVKGGNSGATFSLGTDSNSRATIGIDGVYAAQLGSLTDGYLGSLKSGGANSLLSDPAKAASIARKAGSQIASVQGRIGGFQKFQVRSALNSLGNVKEGLEKARSVIRDVDYAAESAELNRQNILMQAALSMLGIANQQSAAVLALLQ